MSGLSLLGVPPHHESHTERQHGGDQRRRDTTHVEPKNDVQPVGLVEVLSLQSTRRSMPSCTRPWDSLISSMKLVISMAISRSILDG